MQNRKTLLKRAAYSLGLMMLGFSQFAVAKSLGSVAQNVSGNFNLLGLAVQAFFALCGLVMIGMSIFVFIKHNKTEGQGAKLSTAFLYLCGGGMLFYIASMVQTTGDTIWGEGGGDRSRVQITN